MEDAVAVFTCQPIQQRPFVIRHGSLVNKTPIAFVKVERFLADHGLSTDDISTWICHPGGPRVIDAIGNAIGMPSEALNHSWDSMREHGNISSASVLDVLGRTLAAPPSRGSLGVMLAMGPGFSFELLLVSW